MTQRPSSSHDRAAFTIVEMLVSVAVLVLIMTFIGQMMSSVSLSTTLSTKHIDTDNQARLVFDRMANDFAGMPHRKDVDFIFAKVAGSQGSTDGSDKMFFYSEAPALFSSSNTALYPDTNTSSADPKSCVALVGYVINTGSNNTDSNIAPPPYCLQRLSKGLTWDSSFPPDGPGGISFLTFVPGGYQGSGLMTPLPSTTLSGTFDAVGQPPDYAGADPSFDVLGSQVFRMEFCFEVKDLTVPNQVATVYSQYPVAVFSDEANGTSSTGNKTTDEASDPPTTSYHGVVGDRWYNTQANRSFVLTNLIPLNPSTTVITGPTTGTPVWTPNGLADATAIVVAIAVIDTNSRKILSQTDLMNAATYLSDFNNGTEPSPPSPTVELMAHNWQNTLNQENFASETGLPTTAASQIRVYQRFFYLNNY
jgi:hypothetical protein